MRSFWQSQKLSDTLKKTSRNTFRLWYGFSSFKTVPIGYSNLRCSGRSAYSDLIIPDGTLSSVITYINSDRALYSDLNPRDGGQSLHPMGTELQMGDHWSIATWLEATTSDPQPHTGFRPFPRPPTPKVPDVRKCGIAAQPSDRVRQTTSKVRIL